MVGLIWWLTRRILSFILLRSRTFVEIVPPEFKDQLGSDGEDTNVLFKFVKTVYGRRDGPQ